MEPSGRHPLASLVPVLVVQVRRMGVRMYEGIMLVRMSVWLPLRHIGIVVMPVVVVMHVRMRVPRGRVNMLMFMALREEKPNSNAH